MSAQEAPYGEGSVSFNGGGETQKHTGDERQGGIVIPFPGTERVSSADESYPEGLTKEIARKEAEYRRILEKGGTIVDLAWKEDKNDLLDEFTAGRDEQIKYETNGFNGDSWIGSDAPVQPLAGPSYQL